MCHSDGRQAVAAESADASLQVGKTFSVSSDADELYLCSVRIADSGERKPIPTQLRKLSPDEYASVTVSDAGCYALCEGPVDSPAGIVVFEVVDGEAAESAVEL